MKTLTVKKTKKTMYYLIFLLPLVGYIISKWLNDEPKGLIKHDVLSSSITKNPSWHLPILIIGYLMSFIINLACYSIYTIIFGLSKFTEFIKWIWTFIKWIWTEVIIAGGFLLLKVLYHYLLVWPWNIFKLAFESIRPASNFANYKVAVYGLFLSFFISFFGKFLVNSFQLSNYYETIFTLFSILPIGIAISSIINSLNGNSDKKAKLRNRYIKHASILIILFCALYLVEGIIINISAHSFIFSSIMAGGSLLGSAFIILNAALLIFVLSALPSFSSNYEGDNKGLLKAFGSYLLYKWPQYLLAMPAIILPAILVSIAPYFLTKGLSVVSQSVSDKTYDKKINALQKIVDSSKTADYKSWANIDSFSKLIISEDSLAKLISIDNAFLENENQLKVLKINNEYLHKFYNGFSDSIGATPFILLKKGYNKYKEINKLLNKVEPADLTKLVNDTISLTNARNIAELDSTNLIADKLQINKNIENEDLKISSLLMKLKQVCTIPTKEEQASVNKAPNEPELKKAPEDKCENQRAELNTQIDSSKGNKSILVNSLADNKLQLARSSKIINHLNSKIQKINNNFICKKGEIKWSYLIVSIWLCLLLALAFGLALSLFAHLNHVIYNISSPDNKWMVLAEIEKAKSINPNQPLLGLSILTIIIFIPFYKPIMNVFPTNYKTIIGIVSFEDTTIINLDKGIKKSEIAQNNLLNDSINNIKKLDLVFQIKKGK